MKKLIVIALSLSSCACFAQTSDSTKLTEKDSLELAVYRSELQDFDKWLSSAPHNEYIKLTPTQVLNELVMWKVRKKLLSYGKKL